MPCDCHLSSFGHEETHQVSLFCPNNSARQCLALAVLKLTCFATTNLRPQSFRWRVLGCACTGLTLRRQRRSARTVLAMTTPAVRPALSTQLGLACMWELLSTQLLLWSCLPRGTRDLEILEYPIVSAIKISRQ